jgi:hypothetical protein
MPVLARLGTTLRRTQMERGGEGGSLHEVLLGFLLHLLISGKKCEGQVIVSEKCNDFSTGAGE